FRSSLDVEITSSPAPAIFDLHLFGPDAKEVAMPPSQIEGNTTTFLDVALSSAGLYRLDIRGDGETTTDYQVRLTWRVSRAVSGTAGPSPLTTSLTTVAGATGAVSFDGDPAGLTVELVDPKGNVHAVGPFDVHGAAALPVAEAGD